VAGGKSQLKRPTILQLPCTIFCLVEGENDPFQSISTKDHLKDLTKVKRPGLAVVAVKLKLYHANADFDRSEELQEKSAQHWDSELAQCAAFRGILADHSEEIELFQLNRCNKPNWRRVLVAEAS
jgi:hypothetical protein